MQVLFAFLLTVPFNTGLLERQHVPPATSAGGSSDDGRWRSGCSSPQPQHRILFRAPEKRRLLRRSNLFAISGVLLLAVAEVVSVRLVVDYLFQILVASICAGQVAAVLVLAWLQPVIQRGRFQLGELFDPEQPGR